LNLCPPQDVGIAAAGGGGEVCGAKGVLVRGGKELRIGPEKEKNKED